MMISFSMAETMTPKTTKLIIFKDILYHWHGERSPIKVSLICISVSFIWSIFQKVSDLRNRIDVIAFFSLYSVHFVRFLINLKYWYNLWAMICCCWKSSEEKKKDRMEMPMIWLEIKTNELDTISSYEIKYPILADGRPVLILISWMPSCMHFVSRLYYYLMSYRTQTIEPIFFLCVLAILFIIIFFFKFKQKRNNQRWMYVCYTLMRFCWCRCCFCSPVCFLDTLLLLLFRAHRLLLKIR